MQIEQISYREDMITMVQVLKQIHNYDKITLCSSYLNFPKYYINELIKSKIPIEIITSCPRCNGFFNGGFLKNYIPKIYREFEINFLKKFQKNNNLQNVSMYEYDFPDWTNHSKGAWIWENKSPYPIGTIMGSSNLSYFKKVFDLTQGILS